MYSLYQSDEFAYIEGTDNDLPLTLQDWWSTSSNCRDTDSYYSAEGAQEEDAGHFTFADAVSDHEQFVEAKN